MLTQVFETLEVIFYHIHLRCLVSWSESIKLVLITNGEESLSSPNVTVQEALASDVYHTVAVGTGP